MARKALILFLVLTAAAVKGLQHGKVQIGRSAVDGFYCEAVAFPSSFTGSDPIKVFTSLSLGSNSSRVHDAGFTWAESVTLSGFRACVVESGIGYEGAVRLNWLAYQVSESGVAEGSARFNDWTTGTQCNRVPLSQGFSSKPKVFITVRHNVLNKRQDAAAVWVEDIARDEFTICLREARTFDGRHKDIEVAWMAFSDVPLSWGHNEILTRRFPNTLQPIEEDNDAFCQIINFTEPYFSPPSIVLTASHDYDSSNVNAVPPEHNSIVAWNEEITRTYFRACVKDLVGLNRKHHPITVDYLILGDLDPCINKTCDYFANCQALAPGVAQCVCISECPSYEDLVCATNGQTFDNLCIIKREICRTTGNFTYYHPGGCQGFPLDKGRHFLNQQDYPWSDSHCEVVSLKPYTFYPDKPLHIQLTVNYVDALQTTKVHEATVTWTENVNTNNFTACITRTGRNDDPTYDKESVDWMAYQGAPNGGVTGRERFTRWWTGTTCRTVSFPGGKFSSSPKVLITPQHRRRGLKHDATSAWAEDVGSSSFKICLRELQNFDGVHEDIDVDWMAFEILHRPLFSEHGNVNFPNNYAPLQSDNYAFCKTVEMVRNYTKNPLVLVTPTHRTGGGRINPQCNGITAWIESITPRKFRVCMKELYANQYDPVTMQYVVVSDTCGEGWTYFNGFCYLTNSSCTTWQAAQANCLSHNASLTSITSQEENIYVQHRHGGDTAWIGLQDLRRNGSFTWIDGSEVNFTYWRQNQSNSFQRDQNCVHTLGPSNEYRWDDVTCSECHSYTCKRDFDECLADASTCGLHSLCVNTAGSFQCQNSKTSFSASSTGRFGTIQSYTVPATGTYRIQVGGARGGTHSYNYGTSPGTYYGGKGATMEGLFQLSAGTVLNIVVGQRGGNSVEVKGGQSTTKTAAQLGLSVEDNAGTGGGGGSFVYTTSNVLLIAAGGGGGASGGYNGVDGQAGTSGSASVGSSSSYVGAGGSGGNPGACNSVGASYHGGWGAGWNGQGCTRLGQEHGDRGGSRLQGWVGGLAGKMNSGNNGGPAPGAVGGFGGGGGGSEDNGASGGGGGYSGGGSGDHSHQAGGGGGSYCSGNRCSGIKGGNPSDNGFVDIFKL